MTSLHLKANALFIVVDMGTVRDLFRPGRSSGQSFCKMLISEESYEWSRDGINWFPVPAGGISIKYGSSDEGWQLTISGIHSFFMKHHIADQRKFLSSWGSSDDQMLGGCCSTSTAAFQTTPRTDRMLLPDRDADRWGQSFTMSYAVDLQPLPPNMGMVHLVEVAGTTAASKAYWNEVCKLIPDSALFIVVDMGAVRVCMQTCDCVLTPFRTNELLHLPPNNCSSTTSINIAVITTTTITTTTTTSTTTTFSRPERLSKPLHPC